MGKSQKNYMSIKSKLMAAVAMLLVASFMVVSSTYAWFTLSTAPEVTGITTRVGANGNLEIALYTGPVGEGSNASDAIQSNVGDSNKETVDKNKTWGNIIDLSDEAYGLDKITLLPSVMNIGEDGKIPTSGILATPVYGADGRIQTLATQSIAATYNGTIFSVGSTAYGVKAIGTTSGMSQQQLLHRAAISDLKTNLNLANQVASNALVNNGGTLAALVLKKANDATEFDVTAIGAMLNDLAGIVDGQATGKGVADYLEKAMTSYLIAAAALAKNDLTDDAFAALVTLIKNDCTDGTFPNLSATYSIGDYTVANLSGTAIANVYNKYAAIKAAITEAQADYTALGTKVATATWAEVNTLLTSTTSGQSLVYVDGITVNGMTAEQLTAKDDKGEYINLGTLVSSVVNSGSLTVELRQGTGLFFDVAQATDKNVVAAITLPDGLTVKAIPIGGMKATMTTVLVDTVDGQTTDYGIKLIAQAPPSIPDKADVTDEKKLADYYGYAIDLAFRTNAEGSNLMLQTTAANRIYSDSTNTDLMGNGSTMSFGYSDTFDALKVMNLMESIRIVFVDSTGTPVAYAGLNTEEATLGVNADGENVVNAPINLYTGVTTKTISDGTGTETGVITTPDFSNAHFADVNEKGQTQLVALERNKQTVLTAYVYLDGETVTNSDVATGTMSMSGTMNLQFSSDANLVPMNYSPLQGGQTTPETPSN